MTCRVDSDCFLGHVCLNKMCIVGCRANSDCPESNTCINNRCKPCPLVKSKNIVLNTVSQTLQLKTSPQVPLPCLKVKINNETVNLDNSYKLNINDHFSVCEDKTIYITVDTGGGKDNEGQKLLESEPIWLPMTGDGGPWTHCDKECGWGVKNRTICGKIESQVCKIRDCPIAPDLCSSAFKLQLTPSLRKTRLNIKIELKRHPNLKNTIHSQTVHIINQKDVRNGAERTWVMSPFTKLSPRRTLFRNEIDTSCNLKKNETCQPKDEHCLYSFNNLKMKTKYTVVLFIKETLEKSSSENGPQVYQVTQCPEEEIVLDVWFCDAKEQIMASHVCDSVIHCRNKGSPSNSWYKIFPTF